MRFCDLNHETTRMQ